MLHFGIEPTNMFSGMRTEQQAKAYDVAWPGCSTGLLTFLA